MMDELVKKIHEILTQFLQEGLGSRISQFNMKGLTDIILTEIKNYKPIKKEVKENVKK